MEAAVVLESVEQASTIDRTLVLRLVDADPARFVYAPGQFTVLTDPAYDPKLRRAYSFSHADRRDGRLRITVRDMGGFGAHLYRMEAGTRLVARPPQGRFVLDLQDDAPLLLIGGGSGVTPFHAFAEALAAQQPGRPCTLLQSARVAEELLFRASFERMATGNGPFTWLPTVTREPDDTPWRGRRGRIARELIEAHVGDATQVRFYACGPGVFVRSMLEVAEDLGIPKERRHREQWG